MELIQTKKRIVLTVFTLLLFSGIQVAFGQGQKNRIDYLVQKFRRYCELVPREEVFVSTDREEYIAGEELLFNIWLFDRQSSRPSTDSKIVYFELLNQENKPIVQKRIRMDNGSGPGNIELPDSLSTGSYTIRAYTNWMKNFLPENCFMKEIHIYNAYRLGSFKNKLYVHDEFEPQTKPKSLILDSNSLLNLKVNNLTPDTLGIYVNADKKFSPDKNSLFYLFIQTHGNINHVDSLKITDTQTKISIPKSILTQGINQITLFDFMGRPISEKYVYTPGKREQLLSIHSPDSVSTRSKIALELSIDSIHPLDLNTTNLSISVAPVPNKNIAVDLKEYMLFASEFGSIGYGRNIDELPGELVDSILSDIKSNWIDWSSILSDTIPEFKFQVENEDHYLSGELSTGYNQPAIAGELLLLSIPGKTPVFQYAKTNNEAKFTFTIPINADEQDLIIQTDNSSEDFKIDIESSFSHLYLPAKIRSETISRPLPSQISKMGINYQVGEIYESSSLGKPFYAPARLIVYPKRFYGKPSSEIVMNNWVKLPIMEEVFFEIVPNIKLKKRGTIYEMLLVDPVGNVLYDTPPAMLIDGVIIKDPTIIANLNPAQVEKIDVVKEQYMVGDYLFNGIVNVITKTGDFKDISLPANSIRKHYGIFDPLQMFESPDYSSTEMKISRTPDFRNTLYWNPSVRPGKDGKVRIEFWTSDIKSDYEINIQGITSDGKTLSIKKNISIK